MIIKKAEKECIAIASKFLIEKKVVIIPTDTVYGFSGIIESSAEDMLYKIKNRNTNKKLIYLIAESHDSLKYIDTGFYNNRELEQLISLWPAPLTIIFKAKNKGTIAFRCPDDPWLTSLISCIGCPIFSSSANISGTSTITNTQVLETTFEKEVALIVDGGTLIGVSSTILDASKRPFSVVRKGIFEVKQHFR